MLAGFQPMKEPGLSGEMAHRLYRDRAISISRLEKFAGCPYSHYIQYGLKPTELKEYEFDSLDKGNFFHKVMENFAVAAGSEPGWPELSEERLEALIDEAMAP